MTQLWRKRLHVQCTISVWSLLPHQHARPSFSPNFRVAVLRLQHPEGVVLAWEPALPQDKHRSGGCAGGFCLSLVSSTSWGCCTQLLQTWIHTHADHFASFVLRLAFQVTKLPWLRHQVGCARCALDLVSSVRHCFMEQRVLTAWWSKVKEVELFRTCPHTLPLGSTCAQRSCWLTCLQIHTWMEEQGLRPPAPEQLPKELKGEGFSVGALASCWHRST